MTVSSIYSENAQSISYMHPRIQQLEIRIQTYYVEIANYNTEENATTARLAELNNLCEEIYILIHTCENLNPSYICTLESNIRAAQAQIMGDLARIVEVDDYTHRLRLYFHKMINTSLNTNSITNEVIDDVHRASRELAHSREIMAKWKSLTIPNLNRLDIVVSSIFKMAIKISRWNSDITYIPGTIVEKLSPLNLQRILDRFEHPS